MTPTKILTLKNKINLVSMVTVMFFAFVVVFVIDRFLVGELISHEKTRIQEQTEGQAREIENIIIGGEERSTGSWRDGGNCSVHVIKR